MASAVSQPFAFSGTARVHRSPLSLTGPAPSFGPRTEADRAAGVRRRPGSHKGARPATRPRPQARAAAGYVAGIDVGGSCSAGNSSPGRSRLPACAEMGQVARSIPASSRSGIGQDTLAVEEAGQVPRKPAWATGIVVSALGANGAALGALRVSTRPERGGLVDLVRLRRVRRIERQDAKTRRQDRTSRSVTRAQSPSS